jgi:hypothetical protein
MNNKSPIKSAWQFSPFRRRPSRVVRAVVAGSLFCFLLFSAAAEQFANGDCLDCHTDPTTSRTVNGKTVPLGLFTTNQFLGSVHAKLACVDCHTGIKDLIHESNLPPPNCTGCHEKEAQAYATSIHGVSHAMGASGAANCWDCHGSHGILPVTDPASPVFKLNQPQTCAKCHSNAGLMQEYQIKHPEAAAQYHGQHSRTRAAEDGADRGALVRRLSRRA